MLESFGVFTRVLSAVVQNLVESFIQNKNCQDEYDSLTKK